MRIERLRITNEIASTWRSYYVPSLPRQPKEIAGAIREHGGVEKGLHWVLDMQMREDACAHRDRVAAENLAIVHRTALSILKRDTRLKHGVKLQGSRAACDNAYIDYLRMAETPSEGVR